MNITILNYSGMSPRRIWGSEEAAGARFAAESCTENMLIAGRFADFDAALEYATARLISFYVARDDVSGAYLVLVWSEDEGVRRAA